MTRFREAWSRCRISRCTTWSELDSQRTIRDSERHVDHPDGIRLLIGQLEVLQDLSTEQERFDEWYKMTWNEVGHSQQWQPSRGLALRISCQGTLWGHDWKVETGSLSLVPRWVRVMPVRPSTIAQGGISRAVGSNPPCGTWRQCWRRWRPGIRRRDKVIAEMLGAKVNIAYLLLWELCSCQILYPGASLFLSHQRRESSTWNKNLEL